VLLFIAVDRTNRSVPACWLVPSIALLAEGFRTGDGRCGFKAQIAPTRGETKWHEYKTKPHLLDHALWRAATAAGQTEGAQ
jgi:hypothetical protein